MRSIKEWRASQQEATGPAITTPEQQAEPDERDWEFYHTKVQGRAKTYLGWFVDEVSKKQLNIARKGFILQEVIGPEGLNMTVGEVVRAVSNIKRALAKKAAFEKSAPQVQTPPEQPQTNGLGPTNVATPAPKGYNVGDWHKAGYWPK